jgi:surface antigen
MVMRLLNIFFIGCLSFSLCGCDETTQGALLGSVAGATLGGIAGRGIGGAVAGAAIGGILGGVIGHSLKAKDRKRMEEETNIALDSGRRVYWEGESASGFVEPGPVSRTPSGLYCREFTSEIIIDGKKQKMINRACKVAEEHNGSGIWVLEDKVDDYYNNRSYRGGRSGGQSYRRSYRNGQYYDNSTGRREERVYREEYVIRR